MKTYPTVPTNDLSSGEIRCTAERLGLHEVTLVARLEHPAHRGSNDWAITIFRVGDVRVAETNGDPIWEEEDPSRFAELLAEYQD